VAKGISLPLPLSRREGENYLLPLVGRSGENYFPPPTRGRGGEGVERLFFAQAELDA